MATYLDLIKKAWADMGLSGMPPADVEKAQSMHKRVCDWVRDADFEVQQLHYNWRFLWKETEMQMVPGQDLYLPKELGIEDFNHLIRLSITEDPAGGWARLRFKPLDVLDRPGDGMPGHFTLRPDGAWMFDNAPDKPYWLAFEYYRTPKELAGNFDEPLIPSEWQHVIVHRAKMAYALYDESAGDLQSANMKYQSTLTRMESRLLPPIRFVDSPFTGFSEAVAQDSIPS